MPILDSPLELAPRTRLSLQLTATKPAPYRFQLVSELAGEGRPSKQERVLERNEAATRQVTEACSRQCSGEWGRHGRLQLEYCRCRTPDAGRECRDGKDCVGACLWERWVPVEGAPPLRGWHVGRCAEFFHQFGCRTRIPAGAKHRGPLPEQEGTQRLCID
jgi:hypothetical protein